jgi:hypothetical protein
MPLKAWMPPAIAPRILPEAVSTTGDKVEVDTSSGMAVSLFVERSLAIIACAVIPGHRAAINPEPMNTD